MMTEKEIQEMYPVRTMHEFLDQIERETNRFKRGAVVSILISGFMLVLMVFVVYAMIPRGFSASGIILLGVLAALLVYSIYLMGFQYRFFRSWEKRLNRLNAIEEELMPDTK
jgi:O-antigen/teichoic acid export membrane protein